MQFHETELQGCIVIESGTFRDHRGSFTKLYHNELFNELGGSLVIREQFYTVSNKNVLRGMHFQVPPYDHDKLVTCLSGEVIDVVLDLRKNSATFKKHISFHLTPENGKVIFVPKGIAHGFLSLQDGSSMLYNTSTVHAPDADKGIRWNSFGFDWPCDIPNVSARDQTHPALTKFVSPF